MPRLLDRVREATPRGHHRIRAEDADVSRTRRFILSHGKRHPPEMGEPGVVAALTHSAVPRDGAASTPDQALGAPLSPCKVVPGRPLAGVDRGLVRARSPERLPTVFSRAEAHAVPARLDGTAWLAPTLLHGAGPRLMEGLRLRVKDLDFDRRRILVRDGKGHQGRATPLRYLFPPGRRAIDPRTGILRRHHLAESALEGAVGCAVRAAGVGNHPDRRAHQEAWATTEHPTRRPSDDQAQRPREERGPPRRLSDLIDPPGAWRAGASTRHVPRTPHEAGPDDGPSAAS